MSLIDRQTAELCALSTTALAHYDILDTPREERFDRFTRLAARIMGTPVALVTLVDTDRVWLKSSKGMDVDEAPTEFSFCPHALALEKPLVVEDATLDPRFAANPYVTGEPRVRFYAGAQLRSREGVTIGALCAVDFEPRCPDPADVAALEELAAGVVAELELRRTTADLRSRLDEETRLRHALEDSRRQLEESRSRLQDFLASTSDILWETDETLSLQEVDGSPALHAGFRRLVGRSLLEIAEAAGGAAAMTRMRERTLERKPFRQLEFEAPDDIRLWLEASGKPIFAQDGAFVGYRGVARDITARKLDEESTRRLADEDPLTGLANRRTFDRRLSEALKGSEPGAVLLLDVDHFKQVNDTYGHDVGDLLVKALADRISAQVRQQDTVARIGGDEFAVVLRGAPEDRVRAVADRICAAVAMPFELGGKVLRISLSVGAVLTDGDADPAAALHLADEALYASKRAGRARWTLHRSPAPI